MLKHTLDKKYTIIKSKHYPFIISKTKSSNRVLLGIGGNIGDVIRRFEKVFWVLCRSSLVTVIETSPILKNPAFGYKEQDDFYNALVVVETFLQPKALLKYILSIEDKFGRKRLFKDAPRTLDIDMIFYEKIKMKTKQLTLPHYDWENRKSVLLPLSFMSYTKGKNL